MYPFSHPNATSRLSSLNRVRERQSRARSSLLRAFPLLLVGLTPLWSQRAYVANYGSGDVSVVDTTTNTVVTTIPVGAEPTSVAITPDGRYAYVVNSVLYSNTVSVIDIPANTVSPPCPWGPALRRRDHARWPLAYVANAGSNAVSVIDTSTQYGGGHRARGAAVLAAWRSRPMEHVPT